MTLRWLNVILLPVLLVACAPRSSGPAPVVAGTSGVTQPPARGAQAATKGEVAYLVQSGDTVYAISRRFSVSVRNIIDLNNLQPPYLLYVGQRVVVPVTAIHVVRRGDTLSEIADRYDVGLSDLAARCGDYGQQCAGSAPAGGICSGSCTGAGTATASCDGSSSAGDGPPTACIAACR